MQTVIAYDIANDRRRDAVSTVLADHGARVNYSVFECDLEAAAFTQLQEHLRTMIDPRTDRIIFYRLCEGCSRRTTSLGLAEPGDGRDGIVIV